MAVITYDRHHIPNVTDSQAFIQPSE